MYVLYYYRTDEVLISGKEINSHLTDNYNLNINMKEKPVMNVNNVYLI